eukprot:CAMPEP_0197659874 /NCGR_PEP_ID=MMETSP1338-20131121/49547_1 /TAXON_ID=43686 ORGANISM="Pelagodinium beii, Strain RCC1491" /NCGR_SAMPLE_ID=MMETSP1338 /ASSEMBLY_ACC=CAM_ASM_000754 /LENGTH=379 /DNA_ID=CAMNT_0043237035 /DNA_START=21 /DNA_END=1157 /DNA_ORIENTATION=+
MAHFFDFQNRHDEVFRQYFELTQAASDQLALEVLAVTKVQSVFRASRIRKCWFAVIGSSLMIQRIVRGYLGRRRAKATRFQRQRRLNFHFFHHCAAVIQKFFRGYSSRRHLHSFYSRKQYLGKIEKRGEWTSEYLTHEHKERMMMARYEEDRQMRHEFDNLAGELHHLVSTKAIAGVYNPPYNDALPRAFDKPIEQHLRDSCRVMVPKSLRRPRHRLALDFSSADPHGSAQIGVSHADIHKAAGGVAVGAPQEFAERRPHFSRSASAGRLQKVQGPFRSKEQIEVANVKAATLYRSLQASSSYDVLERDQRMMTRLSKLTRMSPIDFAAPGYPPEKLPPSSVHVAIPYKDRPFELRNDYLELPKIRDKPPFFTAYPQGK